MNDDKTLRNLRLKLLKLLMEDTIIRKKHYKIVEEEVNGEKIKSREFSGYRPIHCKVSDWAKADTIHRGNSARERVRLLNQNLIKISKEIRKITFDMDSKAKIQKQMKKK